MSKFLLYPIEVVRAVCDPARGVASTARFAPNLAELHLALETAAAPVRAREARERAAEEHRRALPPPEDRSERPTYAEICRRFAEAGFPIGPPSKQLPDIRPSDFIAKHGITQELFDALPNQPKD